MEKKIITDLPLKENLENTSWTDFLRNKLKRDRPKPFHSILTDLIQLEPMKRLRAKKTKTCRIT
jgi:hypothetical protein